MGSEREDQARRFLERVALLDAEGAVAMVSADYEGAGVPELPLGGDRRVYRGRDGLREWIEETARASRSLQVDRVRFRDYGDALLAVGENLMHGQRNPFGSVEQRHAFVAVFRFDGALIKSVRSYAHYDDAVAAEGLSEGEPE